MTTLGAVFRPQLPPERLRPVVRAAEDAGLEELWLWEDCFMESGIATASAALAWTERLRVGVGLLPVPLRNVALTAMEAATLYRLFPDRVTLAVGHGIQGWMDQVGERADSPMTLLEEHLAALRALLHGERVTTEGRYVRLDGVALDWPPAVPPRLLAGARGPRTVRLSGSGADGTVLDCAAGPDDVRRARRLIDEGRAQAGRTGDHRVVSYIVAATGPGADERLAAELDTEAIASVPDVAVSGDADAVAAAVRRRAEAGAHTVVLQPTSDEPDPEGFVRFAAEEVRPLIG
ncbi:LLM class flavin-dependent oxidoreductase [Streptomonospora salina]|uniref:Alkanesulfonate monooxygenase SsuD/methylene tetrahydromethanopterin reductase-like flavin-dependent oxidoreductase (Luciferase family) n=1 Tax=Streptomonospora salina TaxID=104205 RepID=A0A841ECI0_9ACTN|nr:LLM class flavin-dependent oxidoreductase [Streptomonospora salina]MBB5999029.1 alkanesulfonate monooxygenase SsuD/methylene tetrahydromethanopterin reductase-like flavin-dependent oxidoreductase (luciferase family) [Streptomonospora salina]